jgi:hypothetical protein
LLITADVHLLLVGFMVMLVMGDVDGPASGGDTRHRPGVAETASWLVTLSTVSERSPRF